MPLLGGSAKPLVSLSFRNARNLEGQRISCPSIPVPTPGYISVRNGLHRGPRAPENLLSKLQLVSSGSGSSRYGKAAVRSVLIGQWLRYMMDVVSDLGYLKVKLVEQLELRRRKVDGPKQFDLFVSNRFALQ